MSRRVLSEEVRTINFNGLFQYGESILGSEAAQHFLNGIDLSQYSIVNKSDKARTEPLQLTHLTGEGDYFISNNLSGKIFENAKRVLPGDDPVFEAAKYFISNLPEMKKRLAWIKLIRPSFFVSRVARENHKYNKTKIIDVILGHFTATLVARYCDSITKADDGRPVTRAACDWYRGCVFSYIELLGAKGISVKEVECVTAGADKCVFQVTWKHLPFLKRIKNFLLYAVAKEDLKYLENAVSERDRVVLNLQTLIDNQIKKLRAANQRLKREIHHRSVLQKKLAHLSYYDELTGLANRRRFNEYLETQWKAVYRENEGNHKTHQTSLTHGEPKKLSLIMCDIDYFKKYNDTYGHKGGDTCLSAVAKAIKGAVQRPMDLCARYGGEEFAVILPFCDLAGAKRVGENICCSVRELRLQHDSSPICEHVTISVGVADTIPRDGFGSQDLIKAADKALYDAKGEGRNTVASMSLLNAMQL